MKNKVTTVLVLKLKQYMLFINSYIVLGILLTIFIVWCFHVLSILWLGAILFLFVPVVAKRYLMKKFVEPTTFEFTPDSLIISTGSKHAKGDVVKEIKLRDVLSYNYDEGIGNPYLILYLRGRKKASFNFEYRSDGEANILDDWRNYIKNYNLTSGQESISITPTFMASKNGMLLLVFLSVGWLVMCVIIGAKYLNMLPVLIIGGLAQLMQLFVLRQTALKSYKTQQSQLP